MSKVQVPFSIPSHPEFRFNLTLESNSVEAHSLMDSGDNKHLITQELDHLVEQLKESTYFNFKFRINKWKEEHK